MNQPFSVIIIGAGAAGLMCAITAAKRGKKVLIIDHANKIGKKILMSGGGRCNFTNYSIEPENYLCANPHFCKSALSRYTQWDFIALVESYGIEYFDKGLGQLFCSKSAKEIRDMLIAECDKHCVDIQLNTSIEKIEKIDSEFIIKTSTCKFQCESLVIATGGLSIPTMGASSFGYEIAKQFGHNIVPTSPALSPLIMSQKWLNKTKALPGNSQYVAISCNGQQFSDSLLFTHKGLSGPSILQISSYWKPGDAIIINLLPNIDVAEWLLQNKKQRPEIQLKTLLSTHFSHAMSDFLCQDIGFNHKLKQLEISQLNQIEVLLTSWTLYPDGLQGYKVAEVTIGGVNTDEISSKNFESLKQEKLYMIGEVLDVTGHLGGYNFQWAWASGHAAGSLI